VHTVTLIRALAVDDYPPDYWPRKLRYKKHAMILAGEVEAKGGKAEVTKNSRWDGGGTHRGVDPWPLNKLEQKLQVGTMIKCSAPFRRARYFFLAGSIVPRPGQPHTSLQYIAREGHVHITGQLIDATDRAACVGRPV
jgi:hypothetical protein